MAVVFLGIIVLGLACRRELGPAPPHPCSPRAPAAVCGAGGGSGGAAGTAGTSGMGGGGTGGTPVDAAPPMDVARDTMPTPDLPPPDMGDPCGKAGQMCCPGNRCDNGGCCIDDACVMPGESCKVIAASCFNFVCGGLCGGLKLPCCPGGQCTAPGTLCGPNNLCGPCGGPGEPCCMDDFCVGALTCQTGTCAMP